MDITVEGENRQDEIGELSRAFYAMAVSLEEARKESEKNDWLKTGIARLHEVMRGDPDVSSLAAKVIAEMARYLDAQVALFMYWITISSRSCHSEGVMPIRSAKIYRMSSSWARDWSARRRWRSSRS